MIPMMLITPMQAVVTSLKKNLIIGEDMSVSSNQGTGCDFVASVVTHQNTESGSPKFLIGGKTNSMFLTSQPSPVPIYKYDQEESMGFRCHDEFVPFLMTFVLKTDGTGGETDSNGHLRNNTLFFNEMVKLQSGYIGRFIDVTAATWSDPLWTDKQFITYKLQQNNDWMLGAAVLEFGDSNTITKKKVGHILIRFFATPEGQYLINAAFALNSYAIQNRHLVLHGFDIWTIPNNEPSTSFDYPEFKVTHLNEGSKTQTNFLAQGKSIWGATAITQYRNFFYIGGSLKQVSGTDQFKERPVIAKMKGRIPMLNTQGFLQLSNDQAQAIWTYQLQIASTDKYYKIDLMQAHWQLNLKTVSAIAQPYETDGKNVLQGTQDILIFYIHNKEALNMQSCGDDIKVVAVRITINGNLRYFKLLYFTEYRQKVDTRYISIGALVYTEVENRSILKNISNYYNFIRYLEIPGFYDENNQIGYYCPDASSFKKSNRILSSVDQAKGDLWFSTNSKQEFYSYKLGRSCIANQLACEIVSLKEYYTTALTAYQEGAILWYAVNTNIRYADGTLNQGSDEDGMVGLGNQGQNSYFQYDISKRVFRMNKYIMIVAFQPEGTNLDKNQRLFKYSDGTPQRMSRNFGTPSVNYDLVSIPAMIQTTVSQYQNCVLRTHSAIRSQTETKNALVFVDYYRKATLPTYKLEDFFNVTCTNCQSCPTISALIQSKTSTAWDQTPAGTKQKSFMNTFSFKLSTQEFYHMEQTGNLYSKFYVTLIQGFANTLVPGYNSTAILNQFVSTEPVLTQKYNMIMDETFQKANNYQQMIYSTVNPQGFLQPFKLYWVGERVSSISENYFIVLTGSNVTLTEFKSIKSSTSAALDLTLFIAGKFSFVLPEFYYEHEYSDFVKMTCNQTIIDVLSYIEGNPVTVNYESRILTSRTNSKVTGVKVRSIDTTGNEIPLSNNVKGLIVIGTISSNLNENQFTLTFGRHSNTTTQNYVNYGSSNLVPFPSPEISYMTPFSNELIELTLFHKTVLTSKVKNMFSGEHMKRNMDIDYCKIRYKLSLYTCIGQTIRGQSTIFPTVQSNSGIKLILTRAQVERLFFLGTQYCPIDSFQIEQYNQPLAPSHPLYSKLNMATYKNDGNIYLNTSDNSYSTILIFQIKASTLNPAIFARSKAQVTVGCFSSTQLTVALSSTATSQRNVTKYTINQNTFKILLTQSKSPQTYQIDQILNFTSEFANCGAFKISLVTDLNSNTLDTQNVVFLPQNPSFVNQTTGIADMTLTVRRDNPVKKLIHIKGEARNPNAKTTVRGLLIVCGDENVQIKNAKHSIFKISLNKTTEKIWNYYYINDAFVTMSPLVGLNECPITDTDICFDKNCMIRPFPGRIAISQTKSGQFRLGVMSDTEIPETNYFLILQTISGYKQRYQVSIEVVGPPKNMPPTFSGTIPTSIDFSVVFKDGILIEGDKKEIKSPVAVDPEGDPIQMKFMGHLSLPFVSIVVNSDNTFTLKLDPYLVKADSAGSYILTFIIADAANIGGTQYLTTLTVKYEDKTEIIIEKPVEEQVIATNSSTETNKSEENNENTTQEEQKTTSQANNDTQSKEDETLKPMPQEEQSQETEAKDSKESVVESTEKKITEEELEASKVEAEIAKQKETIQSLVSNAEVVKPKEATWEKKASSAQVQSLFNGWKSLVKQEPTKVVEEQKVYYDPELKIDKISKDGKIKMSFNQEMVVPSFLDKNQPSDGKGRKTISLSELNVARDILDFKFISQNPDDVQPEFYLSLTEWTTRNLEVFVNFTDPTLISKGQKEDQVIITIKNAGLFISKETGKSLTAEKLNLGQTFPPQLPKGVDAEALEKQAKAAQQAMLGVVIAQLVAQIFLKSVMKDLWTLFFALQMICYMGIYSVSIPGNAQTYIDTVKSTIKFEMLNPEGIVKIWKPDFVLKDWITGQKQQLLIASQDQLQSVFGDLEIYIILAVIGSIVVIIMMLIVLLCKCVREKMINKLIDIKSKMLWNGIIQSLNVSYIEQTITCSKQILMFMRGSQYQSSADIKATLGLSVFVVSLPFVLMLVLNKNKLGLNTASTKAKFENLYNEINTDFRGYGVYWIPITLIRRLMFVIIPMLMPLSTWLQIQFLLFWHPMFVALYMHLKPHKIQTRRRIEMFNEIMILLCIYNMMLFTPFVIDTAVIYSIYGNTFLGVLLLMVFVNFGRIVMNVVTKLIRKRQLMQMMQVKRRKLEEAKKKDVEKMMMSAKEIVKKLPDKKVRKRKLLSPNDLTVIPEVQESSLENLEELILTTQKNENLTAMERRNLQILELTHKSRVEKIKGEKYLKQIVNYQPKGFETPHDAFIKWMEHNQQDKPSLKKKADSSEKSSLADFTQELEGYEHGSDRKLLKGKKDKKDKKDKKKSKDKKDNKKSQIE